jgi:hypothetical protein
MSEPDAVPLPREGEVFFDVRGESRSMRLSWYADSSVAVFSIWQGNRCTGTFRLPFAELDRMVQTLQAGPHRQGGYRHLPGPADRQGYGDRGYQLPDYDPPNYSNPPAYEPPSYDPPNYGSAPYHANQAGYGNGPPYDAPDYGLPPHHQPPDNRGAPRRATAPAQTWQPSHAAPYSGAPETGFPAYAADQWLAPPPTAPGPEPADDTAPEAPFGRVPVPPDRGARTYHSGH